MADLSVIIVNYNVEYFLEQCLHSVRKAAEGLDCEVWVVDNNSVDGSAAMVQRKFPEVKLIVNRENTGFSRANNQAIRQSSGRYVLLLNPDTLVEEDTFVKAVQFMDAHPDAGGLGVKMIDGKGRFLPESKRGLPTPAVAFFKIFGLSALFPRSRTFGRYHLGYLSNEETHKVDVLSGAFMLLRRSALDKTGLLDEAFFMYGEDIDLSYRIVQAGYCNYYYPEVRIIHYKGESTKKSSINYVFVFYRAMVIFAQKHFSARNAKAFSTLINLAIYFRAGLAIVYRFAKAAAVPLADACLVYAGLYYTKEVYEAYTGIRYDMYWINSALGVYTIIWLVGILLAGGYDRPVLLRKILLGVAYGSIAILALYALLPNSLRFSRAVILIGTLSTGLMLTLFRYLLHLLRVPGARLGGQEIRRIGIVAQRDEFERITRIIYESGAQVGVLRHVIPGSEGLEPHPGEGGNELDRLHEIIQVYSLNLIIFSGQDTTSQQIISCMAEAEGAGVDFKIAPPESLYIIGSNTVDKGNELFIMDLNSVSKPGNRRRKWLFDKVVALAAFLFAPLCIWLVKHKWGYVANVWEVLTGRRSWVGYAPTALQQSRLPKLKQGVLNPMDKLPALRNPDETGRKLNAVYAREYSIRNDLSILTAGFSELGRR